MKVKQFLTQLRSQAAFTMIELLIVIAILGILAVAVLAAINPVEQINRGRDTGSRSDAEQLISAIDRFYAYKGYYPWVNNPNDTGQQLENQQIGGTGSSNWPDNGTPPCDVFDKLSDGDGIVGGCEGTNELKRSYVDKVTDDNTNALRLFYSGAPGASVYVCFAPVSGAFREEAAARCGDGGSGLPADLQAVSGAVAAICAANAELSCLP